MLKSHLIKALNDIEGDFETLQHLDGTILDEYSPRKIFVDRAIFNALEREVKKKVKLGGTIIIL